MKNELIEMTNTELNQWAPSIFAEAAHSDVSNKYSFVPTIDAINILRDAGWMPVEASQQNVRSEERRGFQKHLVKFSRRDLNLGEEALQLLLFNSHDRGCAFRLMAGIYRFVCSNGMIVGDTALEFRHKHIGFNGDKFFSSARMIGDNSTQLAGQIEQFKQIELSRPEQSVLAEAAAEVVYGNDIQITTDDLLRHRRWDDKKDSLWHTFNRIQENVMKGGLRRTLDPETGKRRSRTRAVNSLDKNVKLNQALHTLTCRMAELKTA